MTEYLIYGSAGLSGICLLLLIIEHIRLGSLKKKYKLLIKGLSEKNVEDLMISYSDELGNIKNELSGNIENRISDLERRMPTCLRNVGLVTYNAFDNIGNNMSFSLAAIDDRKNGFILTGIYTRENSYIYSKEIVDGGSKRELSREEKEALSRALPHVK